MGAGDGWAGLLRTCQLTSVPAWSFPPEGVEQHLVFPEHQIRKCASQPTPAARPSLCSIFLQVTRHHRTLGGTSPICPTGLLRSRVLGSVCLSQHADTWRRSVHVREGGVWGGTCVCLCGLLAAPLEAGTGGLWGPQHLGPRLSQRHAGGAEALRVPLCSTSSPLCRAPPQRLVLLPEGCVRQAQLLPAAPSSPGVLQGPSHSITVITAASYEPPPCPRAPSMSHA